MTHLIHLQPVEGRAEKTDRHQRRRDIALLVAQQGRVTIDEIRERFHVSGVTARGDLDALEGAGDLVRSHGGAVSRARPPQPLFETNRAGGQPAVSDEQTRLARAAMALVRPSETVMISSGAAAAEMARLMRSEHAKKATVITYSLPVASLLGESSHISLLMLGGLHRYPQGILVGPQAEQMLKSLHASQCFLNTAGLNAETGITTSDIAEAHLNQRMMEAASEVTLLAELKSFGQRSLAHIAPLERIRRVICDRNAPGGDVKALQERGVDVILV